MTQARPWSTSPRERAIQGARSDGGLSARSRRDTGGATADSEWCPGHPRLAVEEGIEAVRNLLPSLYLDRGKCARGLEALQDYRCTWDEALRIFSKGPLHNWSAHACDALRYFATGYAEPLDAADLKEQSKPMQLHFDPRSWRGGSDLIQAPSPTPRRFP